MLPLLLALPASALAQPKPEPTSSTRIALLSSDRVDAVRNVLALAEAKVSQTPGITLLDRQTIDKVLAEQKLTLSGLVATDQALAVGKLLSVDLFAVLEAGADKKEAAGLVIFDAKTGVRLWDAALPAGTLDETVNATVEAILTAARETRCRRETAAGVRDDGAQCRPAARSGRVLRLGGVVVAGNWSPRLDLA